MSRKKPFSIASVFPTVPGSFGDPTENVNKIVCGSQVLANGFFLTEHHQFLDSQKLSRPLTTEVRAPPLELDL